MTREEFNAFCGGLTAAFHVVQWGGSDVWKVGDPKDGEKGSKVFAICGWADRDTPEVPAFTFKVTPLAFEALSHMPGLRPAPYLASRGLKWIQAYGEPGLPEPALKAHLELSYKIVAMGFSKKKRAELGLRDLKIPT